MALEVEWSEEAVVRLQITIKYLQENWTIKELRKFFKKLDKQIEIISKTPSIYKTSKRLRGTRECIVTKQNTLFYVFDENKLYIVTFWDNRQNPQKLSTNNP